MATTVATGTPSASSMAAVPEVAARSNPSEANCRATSSPTALSRSASDKKTVPLVGQPVAGRDLALGEGQPEGGPDPHHLAGRAHLGPEQGVHARGTG